MKFTLPLLRKGVFSALFVDGYRKSILFDQFIYFTTGTVVGITLR